MLSCPECGAPADPERTRCDHCDAVLQTLRCSDCLGLNFVGAQHCSRCGGRLYAPVAESSQKRCPRCRIDLQTCAVGESIVEVCDRCGGLWVDTAAFQRICERREQSAAFVGLGSPLPAPGAHATIDTVRYVACPLCGKLMNRVNFARHSGVVVDVCKSHGTWFDKDELGRILDFINSGGIEWARDKETEERLHAMQQRIERRLEAVGPASTHAESVVLSVDGLVSWLFK